MLVEYFLSLPNFFLVTLWNRFEGKFLVQSARFKMIRNDQRIILYFLVCSIEGKIVFEMGYFDVICDESNHGPSRG